MKRFCIIIGLFSILIAAVFNSVIYSDDKPTLQVGLVPILSLDEK